MPELLKSTAKKSPNLDASPARLRWIALTLKMPGEDGEAAYNLESAVIDRYDGGFLVIARNTGARHWHPDDMIRYATWEIGREPEPANDTAE